jgi:hypothetical protein
MASDYRFANPLLQIPGKPDVSFTCSRTNPYPAEKEKKLVFASQSRTTDGEVWFSLFTTDDGHVVHYAKTVDFYLTSDTIVAHLLDPAFAYTVEILLLGEILSLWLELRGIPMIHASAAVVDNGAIAFLSSTKGGKTGLAAAFTQQGHQILTDDILPLEERHDHFLARPGFPALRMWPDQAGHFFGDYEHLELVHPKHSKRRIPVGSGGIGTFCNEEKPLKVIYLPQRLGPDSEIVIEPLSKKRAFFALIQNSYTAGLNELLGLQPQRMTFFSRMVRQVPVRRLSYPDGFHHLPQVVEAVLEDSTQL